jgi:membrane associated rhomboid family serine protease
MPKIRLHSPITLAFSFICLFVYLIGTPEMFILGSGNLVSMGLWIFAHVNLEHLFGNVMIILILGPVIEIRYTKTVFLFLIFITALLTATLHLFYYDTALLGASGIVFMLLVLVATGNKEGELPLTFFIVLLLFLGKEFIGLFQENQISEFSHIVGGFIGALFGIFLPKDKYYHTKNNLDEY